MVENAVYRMLPLSNIEEQFQRTHEPIILNHYDFSSNNYQASFLKALYTDISEFNLSAQCDCQHLEGDSKLGMICPICKTEVIPPLITTEGRIPQKVWLAFPKEIPGVLHPIAYGCLSTWLKCRIRGCKATNYIDMLLDPSIPLIDDLAPHLKKGFSYFYNNFDYIIEFFLNYIKKGTAAQRSLTEREVRTFVSLYRGNMFTRYLSVLNSAFHPLTRSEEGSKKSRRFADEGSRFLLDATHKLSYLQFYPRLNRPSLSVVEKKCFEAYKSYIDYHNFIINKRINNKNGLPRQHIFGARFHWTGRAVIVPIHGLHRPDQIYLPWSLGVAILKAHIKGKLLKRGYFITQIEEKYEKALINYDKEIDDIMKELIKESLYENGIAIIINRNPSIRLGAIIAGFVPRIKTNPEDKAIEVSEMITAYPNADYDGDEMNVLLVNELDTMDVYLQSFHPAHLLVSIDKPELCDNLLPKSFYTIINKWLGEI